MRDLIVTCNVGSSTLKLAVFDGKPFSRDQQGAAALAELDVDTLKHSVQARGVLRLPELHGGLSSAAEVVEQVVVALQQEHRVAAIAHRVVHGGEHYCQPIALDDAVLAKLQGLSSLCPLHQPPALAVIFHLQQRFPALLQIAAFDTAFHSTQPALAYTYALPASLREAGVRAYGFHGLSCQSVMRQLQQSHPALATQRILIAHLGSGASLTAVRNGESIGNSMGFSALEGLPMSTRAGHVDPGVLLYLMEQGWDAGKISDVLYRESGLLGLSGISRDIRDLSESDDSAAQFAVDYFCYRVAREAASLIAAMQGIDAIVFTGGIGEHNAVVREKVLAQLAWLQQAMPFAVIVQACDEQRELCYAAQALV